MQNKKIEDYKKIIFVEGDDDFHFLCNLLEIEKITDVFVQKINGKTKLKPALKAFLNVDHFNKSESIAIIVDADESFTNTEKSVIQTLKELKITAPKNHADVSEHDNKKISFFVMPGKGKEGAIEDLIMTHASGKELFKHVEIFFSQVKDDESRIKGIDKEYLFPINEKKAKVQVFLSSNHESDSRIGVSMKKRIIDTSDMCFNEIKDFILKI